MRVIEDQIIEESKKNFAKKGSLFSSYGTPYDFESIMHYDEEAFSISNEKTIIPLLPNTTIRSVRLMMNIS